MSSWQDAMIGVVVLLLVLGGSILRWLADAPNSRWRSVGSSLLTGATFALVGFFITFTTKQHENEVAGRQAGREKQVEERQALTEKQQTLKLTIGLQHDLQRVDLKGKELSGFDLAGKNLSGADLEGANLNRARLVGATLDGAILTNASLYGAFLEGASLRNTSLDGSDLTHAHLNGALLEGASLGVGTNRRPTTLVHTVLNDARMHGACLASARLGYARLNGADLGDAVLTDADLRGALFDEDGIPVNLDGAATARVKIDAGNEQFLPARRHVGRGTRRSRPARPPAAKEDKLVMVHDGDTIKLQKRGWTRLIGVDTPNLDDHAGVGRAARSLVVRKLRGQPAVWYTLGPRPRERRPGNKGRWQVYIWLAHGRLLNQALLEGGYGRRQTNQHENPHYVPQLDNAQGRAMTAGLRIWTTCE
jgi:uncharacterized protein YjbI with pentapeptide repeats